jgi:hypothetical protein
MARKSIAGHTLLRQHAGAASDGLGLGERLETMFLPAADDVKLVQRLERDLDFFVGAGKAGDRVRRSLVCNRSRHLVGSAAVGMSVSLELNSVGVGDDEVWERFVYAHSIECHWVRPMSAGVAAGATAAMVSHIGC